MASYLTLLGTSCTLLFIGGLRAFLYGPKFILIPAVLAGALALGALLVAHHLAQKDRT